MKVVHLEYYRVNRGATQLALVAGLPMLLLSLAVWLFIDTYGMTVLATLWSIFALVAVIIPGQMLLDWVDSKNQKVASERYQANYLSSLSESELLRAKDSPEFTEEEKDLIKLTLDSCHPGWSLGSSPRAGS